MYTLLLVSPDFDSLVFIRNVKTMRHLVFLSFYETKEIYKLRAKGNNINSIKKKYIPPAADTTDWKSNVEFACHRRKKESR